MKPEENKSRELREDEGRSLLSNGRKRKDENTRKNNKLWLWLGVLILIFILLWWLWTAGMLDDITGFTNG